MGVPAKILELVERFGRNIEAYKSGRYNETQVRREFIDPFFTELGWDVDNTKGYAEAYKDVIHEDAIRIGAATKAPDYCFRIGGTRKFFLEAKKPSVNLKDDINPAYQLRRYAWSAKLGLSILTDFEEFAVYDCRVKPVKMDKASTARIQFLTYTEYADRWDEIASIFSREAVLRGSFDKYAETSKRKKGTAEVDEAFLLEIEEWRDHLARNLALRNPAMSNRQLNFAVQKTIDRIIFLRICEDRGIERYGELQQLLNGPDVYARMLALFRKADDRYNSGLFHFQKEKGRPGGPDELTPGLAVDDKVLKDIVRRLYYPESPYAFSVLPAEILGHVYEQFLGKVITLTAGHRAKIEEKPEVKKAGGVYYTPSYIVDYIVENTVGKLVEGKTPKQAEKIKILDPACGSGSFLLGAYQFLLDWHLKYYLENEPEKWQKKKAPPITETDGPSSYKLTAAERKKILLNNIYGVDIDSQAVEVTKLSLLLKVLEGEKQLVLFHRERALPDLGENIKCGNSLIGTDFYRGQQGGLFDEEEQYKINAFDWEDEFREIFKGSNPGFDAVIGNPPYIPTELMSQYEKNYYKNKFIEITRKYDTSILFILSMIRKLNNNGLLGFITSVTWQTGQNYSKVREFIFTKAGLTKLINLPYDVFKNAYVDTGVFVIKKTKSGYYDIYRFPKKEKCPDMADIPYIQIDTALIEAPDFQIVLDPVAQQILLKSKKRNFIILGEITESTQGLSASVFKLNDKQINENYYPFLQQGQIYRYKHEESKICYADLANKESLKKFYEAKDKLLIRRVINRQDRLMATLYRQKMVFKKDVNPFVLIDSSISPLYLLGIVNSSLISYLYVNTSSIATKDDFRQTTLAELRSLPLPKYDHKNERHNSLTTYVNKMLDLHNRLQTASTPEERRVLERQIAGTDRAIDALVYELYGLTEEEIRIVEESGGG